MGNDDTSDKLKTDTLQTEGRDEKGRFVEGNKPKAGFDKHPENRNPGGWRKEVSFSYQYKRFMAMTSKELAEWASTPSDKRTVVEDLAYSRVVSAKKSLPDVKEITDRTEGKPQQTINGNINGDLTIALVEFVGDEDEDTDT